MSIKIFYLLRFEKHNNIPKQLILRNSLLLIEIKQILCSCFKFVYFIYLNKFIKT